MTSDGAVFPLGMKPLLHPFSPQRKLMPGPARIPGILFPLRPEGRAGGRRSSRLGTRNPLTCRQASGFLRGVMGDSPRESRMSYPNMSESLRLGSLCRGTSMLDRTSSSMLLPHPLVAKSTDSWDPLGRVPRGIRATRSEDRDVVPGLTPHPLLGIACLMVKPRQHRPTAAARFPSGIAKQ